MTPPLNTNDDMVQEMIALAREAPDDAYRDRFLNLAGTLYLRAFNPTVIERERLCDDAQAWLDAVEAVQEAYRRDQARPDGLRPQVAIVAEVIRLHRQMVGSMPSPKIIPELIADMLAIPQADANNLWWQVRDTRLFHMEWVRFVTDGPGMKERALAVPT